MAVKTVNKKTRTPEEQVRWIKSNNSNQSGLLTDLMNKEFISKNPSAIKVDRTSSDVLSSIIANVTLGYNLEQDDIDLVADVVVTAIKGKRALNNPVVDIQSFFAKILDVMASKLSDDDNRISTIQDAIIESVGEENIDSVEAYTIATYIYVTTVLDAIMANVTVAASTSSETDSESEEKTEDTESDTEDSEENKEEGKKQEKTVKVKPVKVKRDSESEETEKTETRSSRRLNKFCDDVIDDLYDEVTEALENLNLIMSEEDIVKALDKEVRFRVEKLDSLRGVSEDDFEDKNGDDIVASAVARLTKKSIFNKKKKESRKTMTKSEILYEISRILIPDMEKICGTREKGVKVWELLMNDTSKDDEFDTIVNKFILDLITEKSDNIVELLGGSYARFYDFQKELFNLFKKADEDDEYMDKLADSKLGEFEKTFSEEELDMISDMFGGKKSSKDDTKEESRKTRRHSSILHKDRVSKAASSSNNTKLFKASKGSSSNIILKDMSIDEKKELYGILFNMSKKEVDAYWADLEYEREKDPKHRADTEVVIDIEIAAKLGTVKKFEVVMK